MTASGRLLPNDVSVARCDAKRQQLRLSRSGSLLPQLNDNHCRACSPCDRCQPGGN